ncbi:MAG: putative LPS assembly protein LptD [Bacteroidales bacterium]
MAKPTKYFLLIVTLILLFSLRAQKPVGRALSKVKAETNLASKDSVRDSSVLKKSSKSALEAKVEYESKDSIVFLGNNAARMYGQGKVNYKDIELKAEYIQMAMDSSIVFAHGEKDTTEKIIGKPIFKDKGGEYNSETMRYNFKSKRGYITNVLTEQGEGFVVGGKTKKTPNDDLYMTDCKYTTCDNHDHPHFYFNLTKAKVRPKKNIVTGPAYLVLEDVPLPLAIPFGFFPFSSKYSSGILMPTFGEELTRGFYLRDGGYYFALNDYIDFAARGEIFSKGSWGLSALSTYSKRYKYSGSFNIATRTTITGDKGAADYSKSKDFSLTWSHMQDAKASQYTTFSANVNYSTSSFDRRDLGAVYDPSRFTRNTKSSSVNITRRFPNSPISLSSSMNISQRSSDSSVSVTLPDLNISMSRIFPFKRKNAVGSERWYEKIGLSYTGMLRNSIDTKEDKLFSSNLIRDWRNGMQHNIPISATFNLFKYIAITPNVNYSEVWFSNQITRGWSNTLNREVALDTIWGFNRMYRYQTGISASTKLYGFYKPLPALFGHKIEMIRHVFTPTIGFNYTPNFQSEKFGFWRTYNYVNDKGNQMVGHYSPYQSGLFYSAPSTLSGSIDFSMKHNLEMKIKSDADSTGVKKISLIDEFSTGIGYNIAADSMRWSQAISANLRLKLTKTFTLNLAGTFDPYTYRLDANGNPVKVNVLRWERGFSVGRLMNTGTQFSYTLNNETFKKLFSKSTKEKDKPKTGAATDDVKSPTANVEADDAKSKKENEKSADFDSDGYMVWSVPWSLNVNYSMTYGYDYADFNKAILEYNRKITHSLGFSGTLPLTKDWSFSTSFNYDFDAKKISYSNINITRNLHCWQMTGNVMPFGIYRSFNINISVKSSLLKDVKYDKRGSSYDAMQWY